MNLFQDEPATAGGNRWHWKPTSNDANHNLFCLELINVSWCIVCGKTSWATGSAGYFTRVLLLQLPILLSLLQLLPRSSVLLSYILIFLSVMVINKYCLSNFNQYCHGKCMKYNCYPSTVSSSVSRKIFLLLFLKIFLCLFLLYSKTVIIKFQHIFMKTKWLKMPNYQHNNTLYRLNRWNYNEMFF